MRRTSWWRLFQTNTVKMFPSPTESDEERRSLTHTHSHPYTGTHAHTSCRFSRKRLQLLLLFLFIGWQRVAAAYLQQIVSPDVLQGEKSPNTHTHTHTQLSLCPDGRRSLWDSMMLVSRCGNEVSPSLHVTDVFHSTCFQWNWSIEDFQLKGLKEQGNQTFVRIKATNQLFFDFLDIMSH